MVVSASAVILDSTVMPRYAWLPENGAESRDRRPALLRHDARRRRATVGMGVSNGVKVTEQALRRPWRCPPAHPSGAELRVWLHPPCLAADRWPLQRRAGPGKPQELRDGTGRFSDPPLTDSARPPVLPRRRSPALGRRVTEWGEAVPPRARVAVDDIVQLQASRRELVRSQGRRRCSASAARRRSPRSARGRSPARVPCR
jgi:hypothetical protein